MKVGSWNHVAWETLSTLSKTKTPLLQNKSFENNNIINGRRDFYILSFTMLVREQVAEK